MRSLHSGQEFRIIFSLDGHWIARRFATRILLSSTKSFYTRSINIVLICVNSCLYRCRRGRSWPILLKNSFTVACETSRTKSDVSERPTIDDRRLVVGSTTPKPTLESSVGEFFNRIGR